MTIVYSYQRRGNITKRTTKKRRAATSRHHVIGLAINYEIRDEVTVTITFHGPGDFIIFYHGQEELNKLWRVRRRNGFQNLRYEVANQGNIRIAFLPT